MPVEQKLLLPHHVIQFLIDKYAFNPKGSVSLTSAYMSFKDFGKEWESTFKNVAASYIAPSKLILINTDTLSNSTSNLIETIIHEVCHYNQHMMWEYSLSFRKSWAGEFTLPLGFSKSNLHKLSFFKLIEFWSKFYKYECAPHEAEALEWAKMNTKDAVHCIYETYINNKNIRSQNVVSV